MKSSFLRIFLLAISALFATACDKSGLNPLFAKTDVLVPCAPGATTWMRTTATGTEILILGAADPTTATATSEVRCYAHATVDHNSTTHYQAGSYAITASGAGTATIGVRYDFVYTSSGPVLSRDGAQRDELTVPQTSALQLALAGQKLTATVAGTTGTYTNLYDVVGAASTGTQEDAEDVFRLINLPLFTSQVRVVGFGGAGMVNYRATTEFQAALTTATPSFFSLVVTSPYTKPDTTFTYSAFEDLSGIVFDGPQRTIVDLHGDGDMSGVVNFVLRHGATDADVSIRGSIDYDNVKILNGVAGGGTYKISFTSPTTASYDISYMLATDIDISGILPAE